MLDRLRARPAGQLALRLIRIVIYRRVMGMSAEGAFWFIFSLPWLLLGAVSVIGTIDKYIPSADVASFEDQIITSASKWLTPEVVTTYVVPLVSDIFAKGSNGVSVVSFLIAIWSGSRGIQTFVEANMVINGQFRERGYLRIRLISIGLLLAIASVIAIAVPVLVVGPARIGADIGLPTWMVGLIFYALVVLLSLAILVGMLHASLTVRPSFASSLPGAVLMLVGWFLGAFYLSYYMRRLFSDASVYGVLAAPIAVMLYAFVISMIAFLGAALNAALRGVDVGPGQTEDAELAPVAASV